MVENHRRPFRYIIASEECDESTHAETVEDMEIPILFIFPKWQRAATN